MTDLTGLDDVDWAALSHAYQDGTDVPDRLRALLDADTCEDAADMLDMGILHQGTIYTATIPAMRFIAAVAADPTAAGRSQALELLTTYAESVADGASTNPHYLPKNTDMVAFDQAARAALAEAVALVVPSLDDADPDQRRGVAILLERQETLPQAMVDALHARLAVEPDPRATAAMVASLNKHGGLRHSEQTAVAQAGDDVRFAAAWSAVAAGAPADGPDADTAVALWNAQASGLEASGTVEHALRDLLGAAGPGALAFLVRLTQADGRAVRDGVWGLHRLMCTRRDLFQPALDALLALASRIDQMPDADQDRAGMPTRDALVYALVSAVDGLTDPTPAIDALYQAVRSAPRSGRQGWAQLRTDGTRPSTAKDARADALPTLMRFAHPGWAEILTALLDDHVGTVIESGHMHPGVSGSSTKLIGALSGAVPDDTDQAARLAAIAAANLQTCHDTDTVRGWIWLVNQLPDPVAANVSQQALAAMAAYPATDETLTGWQWNLPRYTVVPLVRRAWPGTEQLLSQWLARPRAEARWAQLGLGVLRDDPSLVDAATADGLVPDRHMGDTDAEVFVNLAAQVPSPGLVRACRSVLDGTASGRPGKVAAARLVAHHDGLSAVWPTLLAVIADQGYALEAALACAMELLDSHADAADAGTSRAELVGRLQKMVTSRVGRDWDRKKKLVGPVLAAAALLDLGVPDHKRGARHAMDLLQGMTETAYYNRGMDDAGRLLVAAYPELPRTQQRKIVVRLEELRGSPDRIDSDDIALDTRYTALLDHILAEFR